MFSLWNSALFRILIRAILKARQRPADLERKVRNAFDFLPGKWTIPHS